MKFTRFPNHLLKPSTMCFLRNFHTKILPQNCGTWLEYIISMHRSLKFIECQAKIKWLIEDKDEQYCHFEMEPITLHVKGQRLRGQSYGIEINNMSGANLFSLLKLNGAEVACSKISPSWVLWFRKSRFLGSVSRHCKPSLTGSFGTCELIGL